MGGEGVRRIRGGCLRTLPANIKTVVIKNAIKPKNGVTPLIFLPKSIDPPGNWAKFVSYPPGVSTVCMVEMNVKKVRQKMPCTRFLEDSKNVCELNFSTGFWILLKITNQKTTCKNCQHNLRNVASRV
jgi:hypothetical protein